MPSATSGRYQSRLFNFFHQQSRRLGEQFGRTLRHLQVSASWSIEALLYPVYMLIQQAVESAGRQLNAGEQKRNLQLQGKETDPQPQTSQSADSTILQVLEVVEVLQVKNEETSRLGDTEKRLFVSRYFPIFLHPHPLAVKPVTDRQQFASCTPSPVSSPSKVLGVASNLANRHLVVVTAENQILDILTPQQQEQLQNRIDEELRYWDSSRLNQVALVGDETQLLPEIDRLLNKIILGKSENAPAFSEQVGIEGNNISKAFPTLIPGLAVLDASIAKLESYVLAPISRTGTEVLQVAQGQLNIFLYGKDRSIARGEQRLSTEVGENHAPKILALIWGAIDYFFAAPVGNKLEQTKPSNVTSPSLPVNSKTQLQVNFKAKASKVLPESSEFQSEEIVDPWLQMDDLFGNLQQVGEVENEQQLIIPAASTNPALPTQPSIWQNIFYYFQNNTSKLKEVFDLVGQRKSNHSIVSTAYNQGTEVGTEHKKQEVTQHYGQTYGVEAKPDWIETSAKTIGYVKHPLEIILEWLDRVLLWVERLLVNTFMFLKGLLRGR